MTKGAAIRSYAASIDHAPVRCFRGVSGCIRDAYCVALKKREGGGFAVAVSHSVEVHMHAHVAEVVKRIRRSCPSKEAANITIDRIQHRKAKYTV